MLTVKIVVLGPGSVGKSAITLRFYANQFVEVYDPTIEDLYRKVVSIDTTPYLVEILDSAGTDLFASMRDLYIKNSQGFLLVYSIASRGTFEEIKLIKDQIMRVKECDDGTKLPLVLVGNKTDMPSRLISYEEGNELATNWGVSFTECSAKTGQNIEQIFTDLVRQVVDKDPSFVSKRLEKREKKHKCDIL